MITSKIRFAKTTHIHVFFFGWFSFKKCHVIRDCEGEWCNHGFPYRLRTCTFPCRMSLLFALAVLAAGEHACDSPRRRLDGSFLPKCRFFFCCACLLVLIWPPHASELWQQTSSGLSDQEKCRNMPAFVNQIPTNILIDLDRQYLVNFIAVPWSLLMEPPKKHIMWKANQSLLHFLECCFVSLEGLMLLLTICFCAFSFQKGL